MADRYEAGTDAREAIRLLEGRGCPLRDDEREAVLAIGATLEAQGATEVLRSHAQGARSVRDVLDVFHPAGGFLAMGTCNTRPAPRGDRGRRAGARVDAVGDARERYAARARDAWRGDKAEPCGCPDRTRGDDGKAAELKRRMQELQQDMRKAREEYVNHMTNLWKKEKKA